MLFDEFIDERSYALTGKKLNYVAIILSIKKPSPVDFLGREQWRW